ncbi:penicillin acylase family protein [Emticicia sp. BO119]|uniref:penicillin acylase family protein n=1 Tax=Emticicia sp. BO119 TaxID=2757768 RepID=UPI0015EFF4DD|nr:penicillin acylase family protein [Emticicia sp. BO119]MBA4853237.1 penicillin acylase family protein [Emticicia sp. BO119]
MKLFKKILLGILILIVLVGIGIFLWLNSFKPDLNTDLQLKGLKKEVEVLYDDYGIPHIYAQNEEDLFYAFGYVHAQDRLFQMELIRRLADGRLAELFGKDAIPSDKFFRTLGFRKHAKWTIDSLVKNNPDAPFVRASQAYVKGINAFIETGKGPLEFSLASIPKTPFTLEDTYIIAGYMGFTFAEAFRSESIATYIYNKYGDTYLKDVWSQWPKGEPTISVQARDSVAKVAKNLAKIANQLASIETSAPFPPYHGSNGWVLSGTKTKSGKPILSNDTHIAFSQPSVWYEAHLECPGFKFYGNFLAGAPLAALGHSQYGGWGLTMFENDDVDFFREKANPKNPNQVWYKDHWEDLKIYEEIIKVKDGTDLKIQVKNSRHGILMNDSFDKMADHQDPIAMWWVFNQFPSHFLEIFYDIAHAKNAAEARKAVSVLTAPGLNFMWADTGGNIAWWAAAKLPKRPTHVNPMLILDGSSGNDDPTGWLDFSQNPQILNPQRGVLYTANNQPADMGGGLIPGYYVPGDRAKRIEQLLLTDKKDWTQGELRKVINDVTSPNTKGLLRSIIPIIFAEELSPLAKRSIEKLIPWEGTHNLEEVEPTIFYRFIYYILVNTVKDELGDEIFESFEHNVNFKRNMITLIKKEDSPWWDNIHTKERETRRQILTRSLNEAVASLEQQLGNDVDQWQWKKVHTLTHKHPLGILPIVGKLFNVGPFPVPGGRETINNLDFPIDSTGIYEVSYGPALRRIIDFANPEHSESVLPTGQSGNVMSKHYDDQASMFVEGGSRAELMNRAEIEKIQTGKIIFKP